MAEKSEKSTQNKSAIIVFAESKTFIDGNECDEWSLSIEKAFYAFKFMIYSILLFYVRQFFDIYILIYLCK